jgi:branched-chain amino acid transport system ATP-binding protein
LQEYAEIGDSARVVSRRYIYKAVVKVALLELDRITRTFGGVVALNGVSMEVRQGEILGLIGPNGAGKTTLFNVITGFLRCSSGRVKFRGEDITGLRPHTIAQKGVSRTFQHLALWTDMTVAENVRNALYLRAGLTVGGSLLGTKTYRARSREVDDQVGEILRFVGMENRYAQKAGTLSHGYQRTLSLAIGLASKPGLLLLDEPLAALNPERAGHIVRLVREIRDGGATILLIEHNMRALFGVCDRVVVLNAGVNIAEGSPCEIRDNPEVITAYLGGGSYA